MVKVMMMKDLILCGQGARTGGGTWVGRGTLPKGPVCDGRTSGCPDFIPPFDIYPCLRELLAATLQFSFGCSQPRIIALCEFQHVLSWEIRRAESKKERKRIA